MERYFILFYDYVDDILERREPHRDAHLGLLRDAHGAGDLLMAGAIGDPPHGGALVFRSAEAAERFADADPYRAADLVTEHRVEPWNVAVP